MYCSFNILFVSRNLLHVLHVHGICGNTNYYVVANFYIQKSSIISNVSLSRLFPLSIFHYLYTFFGTFFVTFRNLLFSVVVNFSLKLCVLTLHLLATFLKQKSMMYWMLFVHFSWWNVATLSFNFLFLSTLRHTRRYLPSHRCLLLFFFVSCIGHMYISLLFNCLTISWYLTFKELIIQVAVPIFFTPFFFLFSWLYVNFLSIMFRGT